MRPRSPLPPAARAILRRDRGALARLITQVERRDPAVVPTLKALYPRTGSARIIGITGPLGVGKSSLVNLLLAQLRASGKTVGVIGVDPSSPFSGGSVLGDRIRLERKAGDPGVFIRSMASRGHAGGVAAATLQAARLLDAFGMDVVLVETVGSGQVDVAIRDIASTSVVVLVPHLGDEVQTLKAGLFEIADVFCINKGDLPGADLAAKDLREYVSLANNAGRWKPEIVVTSARDGSGVPELWQAIERHEAYLDRDGGRLAGDRRRASREIEELVLDRVAGDLRGALENEPKHAALLERVARREVDPHTASEIVSRTRVRRRPPRSR
ncbi:MAG: methylmalonyl Co-A mutase-associated GTPase MeaB [Thermoplasmata archaeon]|nr:methylmalonyl Co-A mutase-associated GTPase MeaB [Thermoplasmata archaeon]